MSEEPLLITIDECARRLRIAPSTAYALVMSGQISSVKLGRSQRITALGASGVRRPANGRGAEIVTATWRPEQLPVAVVPDFAGLGGLGPGASAPSSARERWPCCSVSTAPARAAWP